MPNAPAYAAELLRASARALAGVAAAQLVEDEPDLSARDDAFELWRGHVAAQIADLAAAIDAADDALFVRQVRWSASAALSRQMPYAHLVAALRATERALEERMPQLEPSLWRPALEAAQCALSEDATAHAGPAGSATVAPALEARPASILDEILRGRSRAARATIAELVDRGLCSAESVVEDLVIPITREVGRRWHQGQLSIAEEHIVSATLRSTLADLSAAAPVPDPGAPGVVIASVAGDTHDLALHALSALLEYDGWRVSVAGADTPARDLARAATTLNASLVILSATLVSQRHELRAAIAMLRAEPSFRAPILVGGGALSDAKSADAVGADGFAPTLTRAVQVANQLIGR
ncbi:MAG: cobalamin-dependent protein [Planctomycetota bacterium]